MLNTFKEKIMPGIVLAFITSAIGFGLTWFQNYYNQPWIIINTTLKYSQIGNKAIGNIVVSNDGNHTDEDIVIIVNARMQETNISIDGAQSYTRVEELEGEKTKFVIPKLNSTDTAVISFSPLSKKSDFEVEYSSKSQKIEDTKTAPLWWEFHFLQILFILTVVFFALLVGVYLGKPLKKSKSRR